MIERVSYQKILQLFMLEINTDKYFQGPMPPRHIRPAIFIACLDREKNTQDNIHQDKQCNRSEEITENFQNDFKERITSIRVIKRVNSSFISHDDFPFEVNIII